MVRIDFNLSDLLKELTFRLEYISGKRADNAHDYFTHSPCVADQPLLITLTEDTLGWASLRLGKIWEGHSHGADNITIVLKTGIWVSENDNRRHELETEIRRIIITKTLYSWLSLTGMKDAYEYEKDAESSIQRLVPFCRSTGLLLTRLISPF